MRGRNPIEASCPPDHPIEEFTVKFIRDQESGNWWAHCQEWKCDVYADTATEAAQKITGDIDDHNDKEAMQVLEAALDRDPDAVLEELCKLLK